ncbi:MAG: hypothetical protein HRF50_08225 [Phycisphaerae bacterium]|jgi:hypothetical protein
MCVIHTTWRPAAMLACSVVIAAAVGCVTAGDPPADDASASSRTSPTLIAPLRVSPRGDLEVHPDFLQLLWTSSPGATQYQVFLGPDTNPPLLATVRSNNYTVRDLTDCTKYYWRVVAINDDGEAVSTATWSFQTRCPEGS